MRRGLGTPCLILALALAAAAAVAAEPMNLIVVLVDDMGWKDLGCQGSPCYRTPHIDALAASGVRYTAGYSACTVCSPSRAALLTGLAPARLHLTDWIAGHEKPDAPLVIPDWSKQLSLEAVTLAERLAAAGYATATIGKWHLGAAGFEPERQGFDRNRGGTPKGQPPSYFSPYRIPTLADGPDGEYLTDREADEAIDFIAAHRDRPFFLYLPHHAVHTPLQAKPDVAARYAALPEGPARPPNATYAAMVEGVDDALGRIVATLDTLGIRDRTAIVFTSDNGGQAGITDNTPLRAGKGSAYEGGVRVPLVISWPGRTTPGATCDEPVITTDIAPTILDCLALDGGEALDGVSLRPTFTGGRLPREALYWHYPHYHPGGATPHSAIRSGDWRLVHFYEDGRDELYDLAADPGERNDMAATAVDRRTALRARLDAWLAAVDAQLPTRREAK